jgi:hypothetical protein
MDRIGVTERSAGVVSILISSSSGIETLLLLLLCFRIAGLQCQRL